MAQSVSDYVFDMNSDELTYFPRTRGSPDVLELDPTDSSYSDLSEYSARHVGLVASCSVEKLADHVNTSGHYFPHAVTVRCSKSQETYFDNSEMTCIEIDLDDNVLSSVDALNYDIFTDSDVDRMFENSLNKKEDLMKESFHNYQHINGISIFENDTSQPCSETVSKADQQPLEFQSLSSSIRPNDGCLLFCDDKLLMTRRMKCLSYFMPQTENLFSESKLLRSRSMELTCHRNLSTDAMETLWYPSTKHPLHDSLPLSRSVAGEDALRHSQLESKEEEEEKSPSCGTLIKSSSEDKADEESYTGENNENDSMFLQLKELIFNCSVNEQNRPAATRLAKRLFSLDGFKMTDVSRHLCKKNSFSQLVGEEYLLFFDFVDLSLNDALRQFIRRMTLVEDNQERDQLLFHFSCRYQRCNPNLFKSQDCCHTLSCAMVLLNKELHCQEIRRKMSLREFIENLSDLNDGENFPVETLKSIYFSIQNQPLLFASEDDSAELKAKPPAVHDVNCPEYIQKLQCFQTPVSENIVEFKKGYVMRKCCVEPTGKNTPFGRRGWKMFFAILKGLMLYMHTDEDALRRNLALTSSAKAISIHHTLATRAGDYVKKKHVFRLQTANTAQYLIQTSSDKECQEWIDVINFSAAIYSSPSSLPRANECKKFQRPLMPSTYTKLKLNDQLSHFERTIVEFNRRFVEHQKNCPLNGQQSYLIQDYFRRENYLKFELKRYKTYSQLLQSKLVFYSSPSPSHHRSREVNEQLMVSLTSPKYISSLSSNILSTSPKKPRRPTDRASEFVFKVQRMRSGRLSCSVEEAESSLS